MVLSRQRGVSVPALIAVGQTTLEDAILVAERLDTPSRTSLPRRSTTTCSTRSGVSSTSFTMLVVDHGAIDAAHIWLDSAGSPALMGFGDAVISATREQRYEDDAALLVLTTLIVPAPIAPSPLRRRARGDDELAAVLPLLQTAVAQRSTPSPRPEGEMKIGDLRKETASALGTVSPPLEQLTRVTWTNVLMVGFVGLAVYTIIGGLADVGFDTIASALSDARWGLVLIALILAGATNYTDASAVAAVSPKPIPIGVTTVEQFAIGFVNMAVPSAAGRVATNARYFQKFGSALSPRPPQVRSPASSGSLPTVSWGLPSSPVRGASICRRCRAVARCCAWSASPWRSSSRDPRRECGPDVEILGMEQGSGAAEADR